MRLPSFFATRSRGRLPVIALGFLAGILAPSEAFGQVPPLRLPLHESFKWSPADGVKNDNFGIAVALQGTTAIVGSIRDDDHGFDSGSAYVFDVTTGQLLAKLLAADGDIQDLFGDSVAIGGSAAIVGAPGDDDNGLGSGSAYLFDVTTGQQLSKLLSTDGDAGDGFGASVAMSGRTAIVGAAADDDNGTESGSAYLFDVGTGQQLAKLLPADGAAGDYFGRSVAISGSTAIVGAWGDDDNGIYSGSAYLFDATTGQQLMKLLPSDGSMLDEFGQSVAIDGTTAIVGANFDSDQGYYSGSAYLFDVTSGQQIAKLLPPDGTAGDQFGSSVAIAGTAAIVGTPRDRDNGFNSGSAYVFDVSTGQLLRKLLPSDGAHDDYFGTSVAIGATTAIVGAYADDDKGLQSGSAYLFLGF